MRTRRIIKIRQVAAIGLLALAPALTGCLVHRHSVLKTHPPDVVLNATLDQLLQQVDERYAAIHSMTAFVQVTACTGGASKGEVKCYSPFSGNIIIGKPENINVILRLPLLGSRAIDMVSDGKTFKMLISLNNCAIVGSDVVTNTSQKGLYSLRPAVILDSLLMHGKQSDQVVSMTQDSRDVPNPKKRKDIINEPDYDIDFLSEPENQVAKTLHVIHISRVDLLPYRQDIYNAEGKVETQAFYSNYQKFGDINFPSKIQIQRPLDELDLTIVLVKRTSFNQKLSDDQFDLGPIPASYTIQNMDDPVSAATNPCAAHAPQSTR
jgi:outer membrane lipoprotein-sorting protein